MGKEIAFLIGAGCEGTGQLGLPSGSSFKRDTIKAEGVTDLIYKLNHKKKPIIKDGTIIQHNSISVLYQTICEGGKIPFTDEQQRIVSQYVELENGTIEANVDEKKRIRERFSTLYREVFYNGIKNGDTNKLIEAFLENARFYSFVDSLFNNLREPEKYKKEVNRVIKLYYSAYISILNSLCKTSIADSLVDGNPATARAELAKTLADVQQNIINCNAKNPNLYYNMIREAKNRSSEWNYQIVTTNYTMFAQKMTELHEEDIAYVHGRLDLFEDVKSKRVADLTAFSDSDFIFPFIFVQSGIKPVVSGYQIKELEKARQMIIESDILLILGYGINSDDEHISNLLRERLCSGKNINCFLYENTREKQQNVMDILFANDGISFYGSDKFGTFLSDLQLD